MRLTVNFPLAERIAFCKAVAPYVVRLPGVYLTPLLMHGAQDTLSCEAVKLKSDEKHNDLRVDVSTNDFRVFKN